MIYKDWNRIEGSFIMSHFKYVYLTYLIYLFKSNLYNIFVQTNNTYFFHVNSRLNAWNNDPPMEIHILKPNWFIMSSLNIFCRKFKLSVVNRGWDLCKEGGEGVHTVYRIYTHITQWSAPMTVYSLYTGEQKGQLSFVWL